MNVNKIKKQISELFLEVNLTRKYAFSFRKKLNWFLTNEKKSISEILEIKEKLLRELLNFSILSVPYYQRLKYPADIPVDKFPLQTRALLREHLSELISDAIPSDQRVPNATGGSTGIPTHYYQDQNYQHYRAALELRNLLWTGWKFGEPRVKIWGSSFDVNRQADLRGRVTNWLNNLTVLPAFDLSPKTMQSWYESMLRIHPVILEGYVNPLVFFARYLQENQLPAVGLGLKGVVTAAEVLDPEQRKLLEETFGCRVFNRYGSREMACIAHECVYGKLHVNEDWLYLEIVDAEGNPLPDGQLGQIAITHYFNHAMPFIRYIIEDAGSYPQDAEPCLCGLPFRYLERLEGRVQDMIVLPDGGYLTGVFFPHLFKEYDVVQYQVIQDAVDHMRILIVIGNGFDDQSMKSLQRRLEKYLPKINVEIDIVPEIAPGPSGKYRSTISHVVDSSIFGKGKSR